jgi:multidrug resistance efflux pump
MSETRAVHGQPSRPPEPDPVDVSGEGRFTRFVRRTFRTFGILLLILMFAFLINQHLLPPVLPTPEGTAMASGPRTATEEDRRKVAVCFGFADLEHGIMSLHPSQAGRVDKILVRENEAVPAGAPLLCLDDRTARLKVEEARSILDEATARYAKAETGPELHRLKIEEQRAVVNTARFRLASAQHTLAARGERMKTESIGRHRDDPSTVEGVASVAQRVKEFEEVVNAEEKRLAALKIQDPAAELEAAKAELATTRARLLQAERVLEEHTLRAPVAGKVLRIFATPSELLSTPPKRMAIQFCPDSPRIIRAEVDQAFARRVEVGQPALVEDDCSSSTTWRGHVARISDWYTERRQIADEHLQLRDVRTLECLISLEPGQQPLRIGQRVRVTISLPEP